MDFLLGLLLDSNFKFRFFVVVPAIFAFIVTVILMPFYIKWLKHLQIGQFIRQEGPASHMAKAKTPTAGGVIFIIAVFATFIFRAFTGATWTPLSLFGPSWSNLSQNVLTLAFFCAVLGAADDFSKLMNKTNKGVSARLRLLIELALGLIFGFLLTAAAPAEILVIPHLNVPNETIVLPALIFICLSAFLVVATTNAVNLHDGMDGLASATALLIFLSLAFMCWRIGNYDMALLAGSCAGALGGFLLFNRYPAKIFMGDTGSLFLGGLMAAIVLSSGLLLWFIPLSLIYILETLSVMAQVSYFKLTKPGSESALFKLTHKLPGEGKRLLRMAPLHHHFEAVMADKGIAEWQVVLGFWLIQLLLCAAVLAVFCSF